jgi:ferritin-like metal-binding protein YciE
MFEHLDTPQEAFNFKLGAALKMEHTVHEKILEDSIEAAQDEDIRGHFRHHQEETTQHIGNLEQVFGLMGWEVDESPCPAIEAIHKEGKTNAKKTDDSIVDLMLLGSATEVEHHEIAVYETLITFAQSLGREDVVRLLQQNLESEQHTLTEVKQSAHRVAAAVTHKHPVSAA